MLIVARVDARAGLATVPDGQPRMPNPVRCDPAADEVTRGCVAVELAVRAEDGVLPGACHGRAGRDGPARHPRDGRTGGPDRRRGPARPVDRHRPVGQRDQAAGDQQPPVSPVHAASQQDDRPECHQRDCRAGRADHALADDLDAQARDVSAGGERDDILRVAARRPRLRRRDRRLRLHAGDRLPERGGVLPSVRQERGTSPGDDQGHRGPCRDGREKPRRGVRCISPRRYACR